MTATRSATRAQQSIPIVQGRQRHAGRASRTRSRAATRSRRSRSRTSTPRPPGNTFRLRIGDRMTGPMGFATALGDATPVTNQNVSDQINAIFGFAGTVTVTGASATTGPVDHVRGRERAQGRAAGRGRLRRVHRRGEPVQRGQPRVRQGQRGRRRLAVDPHGHGGHRSPTPATRSPSPAASTWRRSASPAARSTETAKGTPGLLPVRHRRDGRHRRRHRLHAHLRAARARAPTCSPLSVVDGTGTVREVVKGTRGRGQLALRHDRHDRHRRRHRLHGHLQRADAARQRPPDRAGRRLAARGHRRDDRHGHDDHAGQVRHRPGQRARTAATATSATTSSPSAGCT